MDTLTASASRLAEVVAAALPFGLFVSSATAAPAPPSPQTCEQILQASDPSINHSYAEVLAVDGDVAVVGAKRTPEAGSLVGAAYVIERDPVSLQWFETQRLISSNLTTGAEFGGSVAIDGDVLVVGAAFDDVAGSNSGAAYVFERASGADPWMETQVLVGALTDSDDQFGAAVAARGEVIVVGAPRATVAGANTAVGEVVTFLRDPSTGTWNQVQHLQPAGLGILDRFGSTLEIEGGRLAVGRPGSSAVASAGGAVNLYGLDLAAGLLSFEQTIAPADLGTNDLFGRSIDIEGSRMVVGSRSSSIATWAGAAYVYELAGGTWTLDEKLVASDGGTFDQLGTSVALDGDRVLCGSPGDDDQGNNAGAVYEFTLDPMSGNWVESDKFASADVDGNDAYGSALGFGETTLFVGAPGKNTPLYSGGVLFAALDSPGDCDGNGLADVCEIVAGTGQDLNANFVLDACENLGTALCSPAVPNSTGLASRLWAFGSEVAADNELEIYVTDLPSQTLGYFLVSPDMGFAANPGGSVGNLCIVGPSIGRYAGNVLTTGSGHQIIFQPDLTSIPQPTGSQATSAGQTWCFQYWHRDFVMGSVTSNFSDARCVAYL